MFTVDRCPRTLAVGTPVKYERHIQQVISVSIIPREYNGPEETSLA